MAVQKKNGKKAAKPEATPSTGMILGVRPVMEMTDSTPQYYVNHLDISSNQHEFCLTFGRMSSRISPEDIANVMDTHVLKLVADVQILIPPTLVVGFLRALTMQKEIFEKMNDIELKEVGAANNG